MAAHQAPPSLGFSRQEHWSGLPFPSPMHESEVAQLCPTLSDPMDCSLPGSSDHGIFQARVLEWGAIAFSNVLMSETYPFPHRAYFHKRENRQKDKWSRRSGTEWEWMNKEWRCSLHREVREGNIWTEFWRTVGSGSCDHLKKGHSRQKA